MQVTPWIQRSFDLDLPLELVPNLMTRLRGTPARVADLASALEPEELRRRVEGRWSIQELAGHLADLEELGERRLKELLSGARTLSPADMKNENTEDRRHNERSWSEVLAELRHVRGAWVDQLEALSREDFAREALHPRLNRPMRLVDLALFIAEHDDHHLAQMWELRRGLLDRR